MDHHPPFLHLSVLYNVCLKTDTNMYLFILKLAITMNVKNEELLVMCLTQTSQQGAMKIGFTLPPKNTILDTNLIALILKAFLCHYRSFFVAL